MNLELENKVVIVTGGAKGIGRGITLAFAKENAHVICADIDVEAGRKISRKSTNGNIDFVKVDVSSAEQCQELIRYTVSKYQIIDVLCNNAGIQPPESYVPAHELSEDLWDKILDVNLKGIFLMSKYCIPEFREHGGGVIINIASVQGLQSAKSVAAYAASKGAILSLTRQLALEYAEDKIRVLAVCPGTIDTPLLDISLGLKGEELKQAKLNLGKNHPVGRIGISDEIADAVLYLASSRASFMTGEYVCVDGGMMAKGAWA